jgi:DNA-binding response OmpR family regulator
MACARELNGLLTQGTSGEEFGGRLRNLLGSKGIDPQTLFEQPLMDVTTMTVTWRGRTCRITSTISFGILERLAKRPNHFVSFDRLLREVWHGCREDETIRSSVRHLKSRLHNAGLGELAQAIHGFGRRYCLTLKGS